MRSVARSGRMARRSARRSRSAARRRRSRARGRGRAADLDRRADLRAIRPDRATERIHGAPNPDLQLDEPAAVRIPPLGGRSDYRSAGVALDDERFRHLAEKQISAQVVDPSTSEVRGPVIAPPHLAVEHSAHDKPSQAEPIFEVRGLSVSYNGASAI